MSGLSAVNRILGMVFGLVRGFVVVMALLLLVPPIISIHKDLWWRESALIPGFLAFEDWARDTASELTAWLRQSFSTA